MPVVKITTCLSAEKYKKFKQKADDFQITEYALAQRLIVIGLNELSWEKFLEFLKEDLKHSGT